MIYVFFQYWIFIALAFALGLFVGWATCDGSSDDKRDGGWPAWAVALFLAGVFAAGFKWVPGLAGHILEVALMLFAAYIVGCLTGCGCRWGGGKTLGGHGDEAHGGDGSHGHGGAHGETSGHGSGGHSATAAPPPVALAATPPGETNDGASAPSVVLGHGQDAPATASPESASSGPASHGASEAAPSAAGAPAVGQVSSANDNAEATGVGSGASPMAASPEGAPLANSPAPHVGMTDGQRSILAAKEKLAMKAQQAPHVSDAPTGEPAPPATTAPIVSHPAGFATSAPRATMTDGQRSILAAKEKLAAKTAQTQQPASDAASTPEEASKSASQATATDAGAQSASGRASAQDGRPSDDASGLPADDLKLIKGVGPKNETALNGLGVRRFAQIADWTSDNARWVGERLSFPGRIEREHWIAQAKFLAAGVDTPHSAAVKSGAVTIDATADAPLSDEEAARFADSLPQQAAKIDDEHSYAGARPLGLAAPRGGKADDLKLIKGIGKQNEERLHALGVWHFDQIAAWSAENVKWIGSYLAFPGRIDRERWIEQATALARGEKTEFAKRVEAGDVPTSQS